MSARITGLIALASACRHLCQHGMAVLQRPLATLEAEPEGPSERLPQAQPAAPAVASPSQNSEEAFYTPGHDNRHAQRVTSPSQPSPVPANASALANRVALLQVTQTPPHQGAAFNQQYVSPLVQSGRIKNVQTGRNIKINGPTYKKQLSFGWEADFQAGEIKPARPQPMIDP